MTKVRMGMIGGGKGAFIGAVHRIAAAIDQQVELVCGAFSSDPQRSRDSGADLHLPAERCYGTFTEMMEKEASLPAEQRMQFVAIVTPNHVHFPAAKAALEAGFHVLCDKPVTLNLAESKTLKAIIEKSRKLFGLTHTYTGYPMVKQARHMVSSDQIGKVRKVIIEYPQGWLSGAIDKNDKQAAWRTDPTKSGASGCMGDIGTHAENLAEEITGLQIQELAADLTAFIPGRKLDDDGNVLLRFKSGAKGVLTASQVATGEENNLSIKIWGEKGGLEWHQKEPNSLFFKSQNAPMQVYRTGHDYNCDAAKSATRTPAGHPEGYLEAFANLYLNFANHIRAVETGSSPSINATDYPKIDAGIRGMAFIEAVVSSSNNNASWTQLPC